MNADVTDVDAPVLLGCAYSDSLPAVDTATIYMLRNIQDKTSLAMKCTRRV